jgi:hypothetical protein
MFDSPIQQSMLPVAIHKPKRAPCHQCCNQQKQAERQIETADLNIYIPTQGKPGGTYKGAEYRYGEISYAHFQIVKMLLNIYDFLPDVYSLSQIIHLRSFFFEAVESEDRKNLAE